MRPRRSAEWLWACGGAALLVALRLLPPQAAFDAIASGADVYLFLAGMMLLADLGRVTGVFSWLAAAAVAASRGSALRLFAIVYAVGTCVTIVLSNDATAIVLTPAVAVAVRQAGVPPLPYLFACAFIANAASFVLPISNPANLIVFAGGIPALAPWVTVFALPSIAAIAVTFAVLAWQFRAELRCSVEASHASARLDRKGAVAFGGICAAALALALTSARGGPIGAATFGAALIVTLAVAGVDRGVIVPAIRGISWSIVPLVAGLFVLVRGLDAAGTLSTLRIAAASLAREPAVVGMAALGVGTALLSNVTNNLPLGVFVGEALAHTALPRDAHYAAAIGVDLGPNLSVTGSLATILWLAALRREGIEMNAMRFFRAGVLVMPPALVVALIALALESR